MASVQTARRKLHCEHGESVNRRGMQVHVRRKETAKIEWRRLYRGDRGWLSHGLVVTLPISYSLDGGTLWGFTRDMRIAD